MASVERRLEQWDLRFHERLATDQLEGESFQDTAIRMNRTSSTSQVLAIIERTRQRVQQLTLLLRDLRIALEDFEATRL